MKRGVSLYKIAICDDASVDLDNITEIIKKESSKNNILGISYFLYNNGNELLKHLDEHFNVIFLDINMGEMDGRETAELIRKLDEDVILVFYSGIRIPTPDMFKVQPYRYITKQFSKNQMELEVKEVLDKMLQMDKKYFSTVRNGKIYRINLNDIVCISLLKRGCEIKLRSGTFEKYGCEKIDCEKSLKQVHELIDDDRFVYAHNSYIINIEHIRKATRTEVTLNDQLVLTISRSKEKFLKKRMIEYFGSKYTRERNNI